ncbi:MAG: phospho-sugar mutase [Furfurilactobacillus sp.]|uniref:phospho-sugar mutase n=1 Tax=Furfurilactobacillus TaxID=2767882 RepID=UPI001F3DA0A3|nr:phospho-sugar mutase [Furfurilactobacillus sp.]MCF6418888.1 phospho-sugar mutase [Furfurilactobacillus milii]MCH4011299.1 phospho-sugar mutase [Furfurilactobacillus sp.]MCH4037191.1 phospho-sugar mutase [Furfurilactobacillus sp.]MCH4116171.1 phospho-sugar mutase [Furfurilactobacillus sp.]MCH4133099.1 phospho-sugar mutase [Furfurilactobacillus sp.]
MDWKDTYQVWNNQENLETSLKTELTALKGNDEALEDAFYQPMSFGTAGMRGVMGPGINRMNIYTVRQATEGLATYMDTLGDDVKQRGVAISFDSRHHSTEFAHEAAKVLGQHGIRSFVFEGLRPTPELSFTVRHLKTFAGIMITASHNPKQFNGYKIYGEDGAQMPPKDSDLITSYIRKVTDLFAIQTADEAELKANGLETIIGEDVDKAYLDNVATVTVDHDLAAEEGKDMTFVFTPLHGTGRMPGERALRNAGFKNFITVPEQAEPDGDFPTVKFPNPEFSEAFDLAIKLGKEKNADVLIATDPDADRLGTAVRLPNGDYQLLTGNQIAALMLHYILEANKNAGTLPANAVAVKSIVSTEFATKIAESYHVGMINVLTGFKFIAEQIQNFQDTNSHTFMFGFEESYGYLIKPFVRDKDAIQALTLLAEIAAYYRKQGKTLYDGLEGLYKQYGYFREQTIQQTFEGIEGPKKIEAIIQKFRQAAPKSFAGYDVTAVDDIAKGTKTFTDGHVEQLDLPHAEVLKYWLTDGTWIAVRPSGTEPKIKFYIGTNGTTLDEANDKLKKFADDINAFVAD